MALVRIKDKFQVTLPVEVREKAGLYVGDLLDVKVEKGKITFSPKSIVDKRIREGLKDIEEGRFYGPFDTAKDAVAFLHAQRKKKRTLKR